MGPDTITTCSALHYGRDEGTKGGFIAWGEHRPMGIELFQGRTVLLRFTK